MQVTSETSTFLDPIPCSYLNDTALQLIKRHTHPRVYLGFDRYGSYEVSKGVWCIGYGSYKLGRLTVNAWTKATKKEIEDQLEKDLYPFARRIEHYVIMPLTSKKKAAVLSYAHSVGMCAFKDSKLLELINTNASKTEIIREWSPLINRKYAHPEWMRDRRRAELNTFLEPDDGVPLHFHHECRFDQCLLNIGVTFNGNPNQLKAIEYLEKKLHGWDPSGEVIRRFFRYWNLPQGGSGSEESQWLLEASLEDLEAVALECSSEESLQDPDELECSGCSSV